MIYFTQNNQTGGVILQDQNKQPHTQELHMECTGCSNYCLLRVELEDGSVSKIEGNGCRRAFLSVNRQLENKK